MASRMIPLVSGCYYHIYNRGVNKKRIFLDKRDYVRGLNLARFYNFVDYPVRFSKFLLLAKDQRMEIWKRLEKSSKKMVDIISYCLMPNHYHFLLKQNTDNAISKYMANFQNSYAKYFNIKYEQIGHLFQGRFKSKLIEDEETLLHISRYIHLNPYSSALVKNTKDVCNYPWSSLKEYLNSNNFDFCKKEVVLSSFKNQKKYEDFVLDNASYQKQLEQIKHLILE